MADSTKQKRRWEERGGKTTREAAAGLLASVVALFPPSSFQLPSASIWLSLSPFSSVGVALAQEKPLPDSKAFFHAARENIARAGRQQDEFAYKERRTQIHMNPFGRLGTGGRLVYEITPLRPGPGFTRQLLERDGTPVADAEVERFGTRRRRDSAQSSSAIEDTTATLEFVVDRRLVVEGRPTILVTFTPRPDARPTTRAGRIARAFNGKIWVDEAEQEVIRVEATAVDSISYGYGLVARLNEGTVVTLLRERIEDDIWMPTSLRFQGEGRALLLRRLTIDFGIEWFDYRRLPPVDAPN